YPDRVQQLGEVDSLREVGELLGGIAGGIGDVAVAAGHVIEADADDVSTEIARGLGVDGHHRSAVADVLIGAAAGERYREHHTEAVNPEAQSAQSCASAVENHQSSPCHTGWMGMS